MYEHESATRSRQRFVLRGWQNESCHSGKGAKRPRTNLLSARAVKTVFLIACGHSEWQDCNSNSKNSGAVCFPRPVPGGKGWRVLNWSSARGLDMNLGHRRHRHLRHPGNTEAHSRTDDLGHTNYHRLKRNRRDFHRGQLRFHTSTAGFESHQLRGLAVGHRLESVKLSIRPGDLPLGLPHRSRKPTRRQLPWSRHISRFGHEPVSVSCRQRQHRAGVMSYTIRDVVRPLQPAIMVACIQSGGYHCRSQPSPCLCFHCLNPFCQIDESLFRRLAKDT